jgi:predicted PurR-regulated permease PerM
MTSPTPHPTPSRFRPAQLGSLATTGIFVLGVVYTLYFARDLILPIVLAVFVALLLQPPVRLLHRFRVPGPAAPALVLLLLVAGVRPGGGLG